MRHGSLVGHTVVVTGAARGLGRGFAHRLAEDGASVAVLDLDLHSYKHFEEEARLMTAETTDAELRDTGVDSRGYELDLSDSSAVSEVMDRISADFGGIDALVCNAGGGSGGLHDNRASQLDVETVEATLRRNLFTTINCCVAATAHLVRSGRGSIVNMASVNALTPTDDGSYSHYGLAKAAVVAYTRYLARDLGSQGVRANAVAPGTVPTGRLQEVWAQAGQAQAGAASTALGRYPDVGEIANVVRFLVGEESSYITGQILAVDGGTL